MLNLPWHCFRCFLRPHVAPVPTQAALLEAAEQLAAAHGAAAEAQQTITALRSELAAARAAAAAAAANDGTAAMEAAVRQWQQEVAEARAAAATAEAEVRLEGWYMVY